MYLQLVRDPTMAIGPTKGKLFVNGVFFCYTLEDVDRKLEEGGEKVYGDTCIPRGIYTITLTMSARFKRVLPLLHDVPGFSGIRIHIGNTSSDTDGCILVGDTNQKAQHDFIGSSRVAFERLMEVLSSSDDIITIEIV